MFAFVIGFQPLRNLNNHEIREQQRLQEHFMYLSSFALARTTN